MVNDEVVDSVLQEPAKRQIPFVYAIDPNYAPDEEDEDEDYRGHLRIAVEQVPNFWCEVGPDDGRAMEKFRPCDGIARISFG